MPPKPKNTTKPSKQQPSAPSDVKVEDQWLLHPARKLLKEAFMKDEIPLDWNRRPKDIYDKYANTEAFAGMPYDGKFTNRLRGMRDICRDKKNRIVEDKIAYDIFRANFPVVQQNAVGALRWHGSLAEHYLKEDMKAGLHKGKTPADFRETRDAYKEFSKERFRKHIDQEKRLWKLEHLLRWKEEKKAAGGKKPKKKGRADNKKTTSNEEQADSESNEESDSESNEESDSEPNEEHLGTGWI